MLRILFVDDDPDILESLETLLWLYRAQWRADFACSGSDAIDLMNQQSFDIIVSDLRMPAMDGREVLAWAMRERPTMVRVILSGQASLVTAVRSLAVTHRFMSKPCRAGSLRHLLEQVSQLLELLPDTGVCAALGKLGGLPASLRMFEALAEGIKDSRVDLDQIADLVESDVAVAAKVLQVASTPYFGFDRPAICIREAVKSLGFQVVADTLLAVELMSPVAGPGPEGHRLNAMLRHARATAVMARQLVADPAQAPAAYTAGLLHSIGNIALEHLGMPEARDPGSAASAYLLGLWGIAPTLIDGIVSSDDPKEPSGESPGIAEALHVARYLAWASVTPSLPAPPVRESLLERMQPVISAKSLVETSAVEVLAV